MAATITRPEISRSLVLSTAHIRTTDRDLLREEAGANTTPVAIVYERGEHGFLVYVPSGTGPEFAEFLGRSLDRGYSREFLDLLGMARALECEYLHLDADGPVYSDVTAFNW